MELFYEPIYVKTSTLVNALLKNEIGAVAYALCLFVCHAVVLYCIETTKIIIKHLALDFSLRTPNMEAEQISLWIPQRGR